MEEQANGQQANEQQVDEQSTPTKKHHANANASMNTFMSFLLICGIVYAILTFDNPIHRALVVLEVNYDFNQYEAKDMYDFEDYVKSPDFDKKWNYTLNSITWENDHVAQINYSIYEHDYHERVDINEHSLAEAYNFK